MNEKDKLIESLRQQLQKEIRKSNALEQENARLNFELGQLKKRNL